MVYNARFALTVVAFLLTTAPAYAAYIGDGLYEVNAKKKDLVGGESVRAHLYRKAFAACFAEKQGFEVVDQTNGEEASLVFRCGGEVDGKLAAELKGRRLMATEESEATEEPDIAAQYTGSDEEDSGPDTSTAAGAEEDAPTEDPLRKSTYANLLGGIMVGLSESGSNFTVGGRLGHDVYAQRGGSIALGLVAGYMHDEADVNTLHAEQHVSILQGEILARKAFGTGLYFGLRAGVAFVYAEVSQGASYLEGYGTTFVWGPAVGYEGSLGDRVKANLDLSLLNASEGSIDAGRARVKIRSSTGLLIQAGILLDM
jgi:fructose-specific component phosphotransferase system IIB-like protein